MKKFYNWGALGLMAGFLFSGSVFSDVIAMVPLQRVEKNQVVAVEEKVDAGADIVVSGNGVEITNGANAPRFVNFTDLGDLKVGKSVTRTYTIANQGNSTLQLTGASRVRIDGLHQADFTVTAQPDASIEAGQETSFTLTFSPGEAGMRYGAIVIESNDPDEHPYIFRIQGKGVSQGIGTGLEGADQTPMVVYPTITKGQVTVKAEDITQVQVFDMTGQSVLEEYVAHANMHTLDLATLNKGIYLIKAKSRNGWMVKKVIKQ